MSEQPRFMIAFDVRKYQVGMVETLADGSRTIEHFENNESACEEVAKRANSGDMCGWPDFGSDSDMPLLPPGLDIRTVMLRRQREWLDAFKLAVKSDNGAA